MRPVKAPHSIEYEFTQDIGLLHQYYLLREQVFLA